MAGCDKNVWILEEIGIERLSIQFIRNDFLGKISPLYGRFPTHHDMLSKSNKKYWQRSEPYMLCFDRHQLQRSFRVNTWNERQEGRRKLWSFTYTSGTGTACYVLSPTHEHYLFFVGDTTMYSSTCSISEGHIRKIFHWVFTK